MALDDGLEPAVEIFAGGFANMASYAWVLIPIIIIVSIGLGAFIIHSIKRKKRQWTHKLRVRRVLPDGRLTEASYHRMRRFPLIQNAEVFELETPLLGGYLFPEVDEYSGHNEFSIILDKNNRIYTNKGEFFNPDKGYVQVSAKHSEIDIQRANLRAKYQTLNAPAKRIEWSTIAKYAMISIAIIAVSIIAIIGIQKWGENQQYQAQKAQAEVAMLEQLNQALDSVESNSNVNLLIIDKLEELYETKNIQGIIQQSKNKTIQL